MDKEIFKKELENYLIKYYKACISENVKRAINKSKNKYLQCKQK
jgi:hypothetical protein